MLHHNVRSPWPLALSLLLPGLLLVGCDDGSGEDDEASLVDEEEATSPRAGSVVATFRDGVAGYAGTTDTTLQESAPATVAGGEATIRLDRDAPAGSGKSVDGLLRFDLAGVPAGSTVESVKLTVHVVNATSGEGYALYAAKRTWSEAQATWTSAASGSAWATAGARGANDRGAQVLGTLLPTATGAHTLTLNADGVAAVQGWVDQPASNRGFVLDAQTNMDGLVFASAEAATVGERPQLSVTYTPASGGGFVHPGILVDKAQLDAVKAKVQAGAEPALWQINKARASKYGKTTYVAKPVTTMLCGNSGSKMDQGCSASRDDALAAYTLALLWYYTGDQAYANTAIKILDAWSLKLTAIPYVSTDNNTWNGPLQAAWLSELFPRSAEILRHTGAGWPAADAERFGDMLRDVMLPRIVNGWYGGGNNWNSSMANGVINIGIYNDDVALYDKGVALWRLHLPYGMYQKSDGAYPRIPSEFRTPQNTWKPGKLNEHWHGQPEFNTDRTDGITVESCRDLSHTQMGLAGFVNSAETARIQGLDLFGEAQARIVDSHEFVARALNEYGAKPRALDVATPSWLCGGTMNIQDLPTWEIVYNHYVGRKGLVMGETAETITRIRATQKTPVKMLVDGVMKDVYVLPYTNLQMAWETLTHGLADAAL